MIAVKKTIHDILHLFFPHVCTGCGSDLLSKGSLLCVQCISNLPHTGFATIPDNPVEKVFAGRLPVKAAHSEFYFSKGQLVQQLIHQLKYKDNKQIGHYLGTHIGYSISTSSRFSGIDYIVPLPLYASKEFKRGYNQAAMICHGIADITQVPVLEKNVIRKRQTETQTRKHRAERWQNVDGSFCIQNPAQLAGKNILLVDDVITTGATLEACARAILQIPGTSISLAALAHASK